jgi:hypothetical protein
MTARSFARLIMTALARLITFKNRRFGKLIQICFFLARFARWSSNLISFPPLDQRANQLAIPPFPREKNGKVDSNNICTNPFPKGNVFLYFLFWLGNGEPYIYIIAFRGMISLVSYRDVFLLLPFSLLTKSLFFCFCFLIIFYFFVFSVSFLFVFVTRFEEGA